MALIQLADVMMSFGADPVLRGVSLGLHPNQRVGLIGANGSGKTTLLRILAGSLQPEAGRVEFSRRIQPGFLEQEPDLSAGGNVHDAGLAAFDELLDMERRMREVEHQIAVAAATERHNLLSRLGRLQERFERAGGYECENRTGAALMGLGFTRDDFTRPVSVLSGGERSRLALARLLLREPDLLLLDEPTNHLDIGGIEWIENFLAKRFRGAAVLVSHDRTFLDQTVTRILELNRGRLTDYPGNYSAYVRLREHRRLEQQREHDKQQEFIRKQEAFIRRHHAGQRGREARGRQTRLDRIERVEAPAQDKRMSVRFEPGRESGEVCLRAEGLSMRFGDRILFRDLGFEVHRGDRVGVIGPNGSGKTTLLRILLGDMDPDEGLLERGHHLAFGYLDQQAGGLSSDRTVLEEVWERRRRMNEVDVRGVLGRFLFTGDEAVEKRMCDLSGGERTRVALACLMVDQPNVLVMDEPTNHLDIAARVALESALHEYAGTLVVVSHDRYFLNRVVSKLIVLGDDGGRFVHGNYEDYERLRRSRVPEEKRALPVAAPPPAPKQRRRPRLSKNRLARIENEIAELEREKTALEAELARPELYADSARVQRLPRRYQEVAARLEALYTEWAGQDG